MAAEQRNYTLWEKDPYGVGSILSSKRKARKWDENSLTEIDSDHEEVASLLKWTGGARQNEIFPQILPWNLKDDTSKPRS